MPEQPSSSIEGQLLIQLCPDSGKVTLCSSRPVLAPNHLFGGMQADEVLDMLPLLYNICGMAQTCAAQTAFASITGRWPDDNVRQAQHLLLWLEWMREHSWRILTDWSKQLGDNSNPTPLATFQSLLVNARTRCFAQQPPFSRTATVTCDLQAATDEWQQALQSLLEQHIFGIPLASWRDIQTLADLQTWMESNNSIAARYLRHIQNSGMATIGQTDTIHLPTMDAAALQARFSSGQAEQFIIYPDWLGQCCETGAFSRNRHQPLLQAVQAEYGSGLFARLLARLLDLVWHKPDSNADAEDGIAQLETVRGRLIHHVVTDTSGRVRQYHIVAPTEWNFHPQGALVQALQHCLANHNDITTQVQQAHSLIQAIDPCVSYQLSIRESAHA